MATLSCQHLFTKTTLFAHFNWLLCKNCCSSRAFLGVKFSSRILLCAKELTFRNSDNTYIGCKCIFPNRKTYLSQLQSIFVQIGIVEDIPRWTGHHWCMLMLLRKYDNTFIGCCCKIYTRRGPSRALPYKLLDKWIR